MYEINSLSRSLPFLFFDLYTYNEPARNITFNLAYIFTLYGLLGSCSGEISNQAAASGGAPMTSSIASQLRKIFSEINDAVYVHYHLSERGKQVFQLLVNGYRYEMIAAEMLIAIDTLRNHIKKFRRSCM